MVKKGAGSGELGLPARQPHLHGSALPLPRAGCLAWFFWTWIQAPLHGLGGRGSGVDRRLASFPVTCLRSHRGQFLFPKDGSTWTNKRKKRGGKARVGQFAVGNRALDPGGHLGGSKEPALT